MTILKELPLGGDGLRYILHSLKGGGRLANALAAEITAVPAAADNVFAPLPAHVTLDRAKDFHSAAQMQGARAWLAGRLYALCATHGGGTLVALDDTAGPSDPHVSKSTVNKFFYDARVQYFVGCAELNEASLNRVIRAVASFFFVAAFTTYPLSMAEVPADHVVDDRLIARLTAGVQAVFIGAYDEESFVVWQR